MNRNREFYILVGYFLCVLIYAIAAMVFMREIAIPFKHQVSINGNLPGDAQYYVEMALRKLQELKAQGFAAFELRPGGQGPAGIGSLLFWFSESPYIIVLVNGILHAFSAVMMVLIGRCYFSLRTSIISSIPLAVSLYMMLWFSQLNKESCVLFGVLLFIYGIEILIRYNRNVLGAATSIIGIVFIWLMRPYVNMMLVPVVAAILLAILIRNFYNKTSIGDCFRFFSAAAVIMICLFALGEGGASSKVISSASLYTASDLPKHETLVSAAGHEGSPAAVGHENSVSIVENEVSPSGAEREISPLATEHDASPSAPNITLDCLNKIIIENWRNEPLLPSYLNHKLHGMMTQRCLIFTLLDTQSNLLTLDSILDADTLPSGSLEALAYLPKATLYGVFSPLPNKWVFSLKDEGSAFYLIASFEVLLFYFALVGLIAFVVKRKTWGLSIPIFITLFISAVYGMSIPFIGALYRYRYPWHMIIICLGIGAWITLIQNRKWKQQ